MLHATTYLLNRQIGINYMAHKRITVSIDSNLVTAGNVLHGTLSLIDIDPATVDEITLQIRGHNTLVDPTILESNGEAHIPFAVLVPLDILHAGTQDRLGSDVFQFYACVRFHRKYHSVIHTTRIITVKSPGLIMEYSANRSYLKKEDISISSKFASTNQSLDSEVASVKQTLLQNLRLLFCCSPSEKLEPIVPVLERRGVVPKAGTRLGYKTAYNVFVFPEFCKFDNKNETDAREHDHLLEI